MVGRTHQQIATAIHKQFGEEVEPWQVKYQLQKLSAGNGGPTIITRPRGRQVQPPTDAEQFTQAMGQVLIHLTGYPTSRLYRQLRTLTSDAWPAMSERQFRELLAGKPKVGTNRSYQSDHPYSCCQLLIHPVLALTQGEAEGWLWLVGYETDTGFIHVQAFHLIGAEGLKGRGRPSKPPEGDPVAISGHPGNISVQVPDELLASFIDTCQQRLGLPLMRFRLPADCQGLLSEALSDEEGPYEVVFDPRGASEMPPTLIPARKEHAGISNMIAGYLNRHNLGSTLAKVTARWAAIQAILDTPKSKYGNLRDKRRTTQALDEQIITFYKDHQPFQGTFPEIDLKPLRVSMEIRAGT